MTRSGYIAFMKCYMPGVMRRWWFVLLSGAMLAFHVNAHAEEAEDDFPAGAAAIQAEEQTAGTEPGILEALDGPRDFLSEKIISYSKGLDEFFGDERYFQENNKSVIQLELNEAIEQSGNRTFLFEGKAKLDFPSAQRRFQLVIESNPEQKTAGEVNKGQPAAPKDSAKPEQYSAALRFEKSEEDRWHFSADSGAQLQFPLDPFIRTRGSYSIPLADWRLKLAETVFWFSTNGLGETTQFDMEHVLSEPVLFRATTTGTCFESPQYCDLRQDLSLFHTVSDRSAWLYQASVIGTNKPVLQETAYVLLTKYRYRLHRDWIFFEISPQLHFPKTDDFKLNAVLVMRLEMLFGATK